QASLRMARLIHCEQVVTVGMMGQGLGGALDVLRRAYPANASPPGARWKTGSLALLICFATCSCPARGTWLGRKITQSPTQGSLPPPLAVGSHEVTPRQARI